MNMFVSAAAIAAVPTAAPALAGNQSDERSPSAILARAEEVVDLLRTRYVREGWKIDETAAERALEYFRKYAADGSDDDDLREAAIGFLTNHGQSLDWVFDGKPFGMICSLAKHSKRARTIAAPWVPGDERLWSLYDKFERAHNRMQALDTPEAMAGSGPKATPEEKVAHKKWERAGNAAFRTARRVLAEPALTGDGLLMKIHVAGFEFDAKPGTFAMPYRGTNTPKWSPGRFSNSEAEFIAGIGEDLRRAKLTLS